MRECATELYFCPVCDGALTEKEMRDKDSVLRFFKCASCSKEFFKIKGVKDLYPRYHIGDFKISC